MASYLYASNVSPRDSFNRIDLQRDDGTKLTLRRGGAYDLTSNELARARRYIVLTSTSNVTTDVPSVQYLPVKGVLSNGDVPVWSESEGAFVPGVGGGGGNSQTWIWDSIAEAYVLTELPVRTFVGPTDPVDVGLTMREGDVWNPTGAGS
jgi:hypothetical protein